eukprot:Colp12_sorted_trinity150504_noHs@12767
MSTLGGDAEDATAYELSSHKTAPRRRRRSSKEDFERQQAEQDSQAPPPKANIKRGGWGNEDNGPQNELTRRESSRAFDDEIPTSHDAADEDGAMPVIPDLEQVQEEDLTTQIAAPPSLKVQRVATIRELDNDLFKYTAFPAGKEGIDLKLLTQVLSPQADVMEEDQPWTWDRLFTQVASELQNEWDAKEKKDEEKGSSSNTAGMGTVSKSQGSLAAPSAD